MFNTNFKHFLKKFLRYFTFGISVLVLLFASSAGVFGTAWEQGPKGAAASTCDWYEADYDNGFPAGYYTLSGYDASNPADWSACDPNTFGGNYNQPNTGGAYITYEGADCWQNESWWIRDWNDGSREWVTNHGVVPGECGNPLDYTGGAEDNWSQLNNECDWDSGQAYEVWFNNTTGEYWRGIDHGEAWADSACGYTDYSAQAGPNQYVKFLCDGNHSQCGNNIGIPYSEEWGSYMSVYEPYPGCNKTVQVDVFSKYCRDSAGTWICTNEDLVDFQVWYTGACPVPAEPVAQPISYPVQPAPFYPQQPVYFPPAPQQPYFPQQPRPILPPQQPVFPPAPVVPQQPVIVPSQPVRCTESEMICNQSTGTFWQRYSYNVGNQCAYDQFNTGLNCLPPQQPVQQPVAPAAPINNTNTQTQTQTVNIPTPQVVQAAAPAPQVIQQPAQPAPVIQQPVQQPVVTPVAQVQSYVKELPNTGLPLAVWAAAAFLPAGLKFRRFAKQNLETVSAQYLWEEKQFKAGD
jgi:hypothetical protein